MEDIDKDAAGSEKNLEDLKELEFDRFFESIRDEVSRADFQESPPPFEELEQLSAEQAPEKPKCAVLIYLHDIVYLLAGIIVVFLILFRVIVVSGTSMNNTLLDGDYLLLVGSLFYKNPRQGDVIVASKDSFDNGAPIVKRVIATEGQLVDIDFRTGVVSVDGAPLEEPYTRTPTNLQEGVSFPLVVKEGCLFVMGDNRNGSKDSRSPEIGLIDCREVLGRVVFLFFPGTNSGKAPMDFHRIGVIS